MCWTLEVRNETDVKVHNSNRQEGRQAGDRACNSNYRGLFMVAEEIRKAGFMVSGKGLRAST